MSTTKTIIFLIIVFLSLNLSTSGLEKKDIFNQCKEAVVLIKTYKMPNFASNQRISTGTGYVVDSNGYIITNHHVVDEAYGLVVLLTKADRIDTLSAFIVWENEDLDLAVIKIRDGKYKTLELAEPDQVFQGEEILVLGYPSAGRKSSNIKVTWGILSSDPADSTLQTTASINPGNSGGPAVNMQGKVVGTVFSKYISLYVESTGFLRNAQYSKEVLDSAKSNIDKISEFFDTENQDSYNLIAMAEANYWQQRYDEIPKDSQIVIVRQSIVMAQKAIEADPDYTNAYYYLAAYYLKEALLNCQLYNQITADSIAMVFLESYQKAKDKTPLSEHIEYNEKMTKRIERLIDDEELNCELWRRMIDSYVDYEKEREKRYEDFFDYLNYGDYPKYLKDILMNENPGDSHSSSLSSIGLFYHLYLTLNSPYELKEPKMQNIELFYEFENGFVPFVGFFLKSDKLDMSSNEKLMQVGLGYWHFYWKMVLGNAKNSVVPKNILGVYSGLSGKSINDSKYTYGLELLVYDNENGDGPMKSNLALRTIFGINIYNSLWLKADYTYHPDGLNQLGIALGLIF